MDIEAYAIQKERDRNRRSAKTHGLDHRLVIVVETALRVKSSVSRDWDKERDPPFSLSINLVHLFSLI